MRDTIDMARKAGGRAQQNKNCDVEYVMSSESLQRLVESVRADECEACAKVCDEQVERSLDAIEKSKRITDQRIYRAGAQTSMWNAAAIRARG